MKSGFTQIGLNDYVELHLRANPGTDRAELTARIEYVMDAYRKDIRCQCGAAIWIIGSAEAGLACFRCIAGQSTPDNDYEITLRDVIGRGDIGDRNVGGRG